MLLQETSATATHDNSDSSDSLRIFISTTYIIEFLAKQSYVYIHCNISRHHNTRYSIV